MTIPPVPEPEQPSVDGPDLSDDREHHHDQDRDLLELTELEQELTELDRALVALETTPER